MVPTLLDVLGNRFVSLIDVTTKALIEAGTKRVGLLGSPNTISSRLHATMLENMTVLVPNTAELSSVREIIHGVIGGDKSGTGRLQKHIDTMVSAGAEIVLLGCTELSVLNHHSPFENVIDPLDLVVDEIMKNNV